MDKLSSLTPATLCWPLLQAPPWSARWIAPEGVQGEPNIYFRSRRRWSLAAPPASCLLHITAESDYRLFINGRKVGQGPVRGTRTRNYFDSYEIAPFLGSGENWIGIEVHSHNVPTFQAAPAQPGVLAQCDGGELVATDESWEVQIAREWRRDVRDFTFQIGFFEWMDLAGIPSGWLGGTDDPSGWQPATVISENEFLAGKDLLPRDIPALAEAAFRPVIASVLGEVPPLADRNDGLVAKLMNEESHHVLTNSPDLSSLLAEGGQPVRIEPPVGGGGVVLLFDFGREVNGAFELELDAPAGTVIDLAYDEYRGGRLPVLLNAYAFADRYVAKAGRQTIGNVFTERGFRVVQVVLREFTSPVHLHGVRGVDRIYPFAKASSFSCSDQRLNDIWTACDHTMRACSTDTFVDCPWRENAFYINDLVVENVIALQLFGDPLLSARSLRLMASQAREDGLIPGSVPCGILPGMSGEASEDFLTLLGGNLFLPLILEEYLAYSGDEALVREMSGCVEGMLSAFARWEDAQGLIVPPSKHWNFIDWSFEMTDPEERRALSGRPTAVLGWFYVIALDSAVRLAERAGEIGRAKAWRDKAEKAAGAIDRSCWSEEMGCYVEWQPAPGDKPFATQISQALALLSGRTPASKRAELAAALTRPDLLAPELYLHHFIQRALAATGQESQALELIHRYWDPVIEAGSPTIWECGVHGQGKSAFNGNASACHGFATTPVDFLQKVVLGVQPKDPGFAKCAIHPKPLGLSHAAGVVPTPHGPLAIDWRIEGTELLLHVEVPVGITAFLPDDRVLAAGPADLRFPAF